MEVAGVSTGLARAASASMTDRPEEGLANRLRIARAERDLSQDQLARAAGVSRQTISSIEKGQYGPSALLAFRLARVLGVRIDELFWIQQATGRSHEGEHR